MATQATVVKFLLVRRVAETTSDVLVDDDRLVKQGQPIAKLDSRDCQVALAQAKAGFERAKAQFAQSQARLIEADAQLKQAQVQAKRLTLANHIQPVFR